jgi:Domain of unknown function (DUF5010)
MKWRATLLVVLFLISVAAPRSAAPFQLNSGKYGATFYWWYDHLPSTTIYRPTIAWTAQDPQWWNSMVAQARDAGLGWVAPVSWGEGSNADPATLGPLVSTIDRVAPNLKVALFDDTTSEVLRKNLSNGRGWTLDERFDLNDLSGQGEGGLAYFYDQQWKRFFQTIPARQRFTINGRPVVFMWGGGANWYSRTNFLHSMIEALRAAMRRDFGVDPFVILEESWMALDPATGVDGLYDWFEPAPKFSSLMVWKGLRIGHVVPGYDCSACGPPGRTISRQDGLGFQAGLQAVGPGSDLVLIEGFDNVDENAHIIETSEWGRKYLAITKWFTSNLP